MEEKQKPFKIDTQPRLEFMDWIKEEFPEIKKYSSGKEDYRDLVERIHEVHEAALTVLELTIRTSAEPIRKYYEDDLENLKAAYQAKDFRIYTKYLATFVEAIEGE